MVKFEIEFTRNLQNATLRAGIIKDGGIEIPTPSRVLNSAELENGRKIESKELGSPKFPHQVFEITKFMKPERLIEFSKNVDISAIIMKQIKKISDNAGMKRLTIFHPVLNRNFVITDEMNAKLIELQIGSNIDLIAVIDEHNSPVSKFKTRLKSSISRINDSGDYSEPMPMIRMDSDYRFFGEKIDVAINEGVKVINVVYSPVDKNFANYSYLISLARQKKKVWIHMSEVPRKLYRKISAMHLLPLFGIDTYALNSRPFPMGLIKRKEVAVKRFDNKTLEYLTLPEHIKLYGDNPECNCFVENRKKLSDVLSIFQAAELLSPAIICHEAVSSYYEMQRLRKAIVEDKSGKYLASKKNLVFPIKKLLKIDLAQQQL